MDIKDKVQEFFGDVGNGCDQAYTSMVALFFKIRSGSIGTQALLFGMMLISSLLMTMVFGVSVSAFNIFGPLLLLVAFAYYSHSSPNLSERIGFMLWWITVQLAIGVSCIAIGSLLF